MVSQATRVFSQLPKCWIAQKQVICFIKKKNGGKQKPGNHHLGDVVPFPYSRAITMREKETVGTAMRNDS